MRSPLGEYVIGWEQERFDALVADIFGFNALQVGLTAADFLRANRMPLRVRCDLDGPAAVRADPQHLPFAAASLDLVVLPHTPMNGYSRVAAVKAPVVATSAPLMYALTVRSAWPTNSRK